jgi:glutathione-regulated potassium-efflux system ancillary protein KefF
MARIVVVAAHPQLEHSRVARALIDAARGLPGELVEVRDLYARYPDYLVDVAAEQGALVAAELIVWMHPWHWNGMTPLLKLWIDEVFAFGWAYGPGGDRLRGRDLWLVTSTGDPESSFRSDGYNRYFFDAFLPPYEQSANVAGLRFLPPLVLHGAHRVGDDALAAHAAVFADRLRTWPDWPEIEDLPPCPACEVPAEARRPADVEAPALPAAFSTTLPK